MPYSTLLVLPELNTVVACALRLCPMANVAYFSQQCPAALVASTSIRLSRR